MIGQILVTQVVVMLVVTTTGGQLQVLQGAMILEASQQPHHRLLSKRLPHLCSKIFSGTFRPLRPLQLPLKMILEASHLGLRLPKMTLEASHRGLRPLKVALEASRRGLCLPKADSG